MIDVVIDLNLHHGGPSDSPSTRINIYNHPIDPLAAGGTVIIVNRIGKSTVPIKKFWATTQKNRPIRPRRGINAYNGHNTRSTYQSDIDNVAVGRAIPTIKSITIYMRQECVQERQFDMRKNSDDKHDTGRISPNLDDTRTPNSLRTHIYLYIRLIDPFAAGGTTIVPNRTEKVKSSFNN